MKQVDFLIIGSGLAGSLLAWTLIKRNASVLLVDNGRHNASQVAAGLINPVTGMRLSKTPEFDNLLAAALCCYRALGQTFDQQFYVRKPMLRLLRNPQELAYSRQRLSQAEYQHYIEVATAADYDLACSPTGHGLKQRHTGHLLTGPLLTALQQSFAERACLIKDNFNHRDLRLIASNLIYWKQFNCKKIIFCEGHFIRENPWFSKLPLQAVKGEILTLQTPSALPNYILNYGHWLIPLTSHTFRTGASFDRVNIDSKPSQSAKKDLIASLSYHLPNLEIGSTISHMAGIRPCTQDKQPFIGSHPQYKALAVFNGFGAKGCLLIPWHAQRFADYLLQQKPIPENVDIKRFNTSLLNVSKQERL